MSVYAVKKDDESNEAVQRRFKRQVQNSGHIQVLRERSRLRKKPNKRLVRLRAINREKNRSKNRKTQFYSNM